MSFIRSSFFFRTGSVQHTEKLESFVYQLLQKDNNKEWSAEAIAEQYRQYRKISGKPLYKEVRLTTRISGVLSHLVQKGYARRRKFIGRKIESEADLANEQREALLDLVNLLDGFQNQDPALLEFGRRRANEIIANPEKVSLLLVKAKEHSRHADALPRQETADEILRIISSHPDCTADQIRENLKEEGRWLSKSRIWDIIGVLFAERKITQTTIRGVRHFNLAGES